jgi:protein-disulfide isomerase
VAVLPDDVTSDTDRKCMTDAPDLSRLLLPIQPWDHVRGPEDAPFTLVEYGDYECPACGKLYVLLRDLQAGLASKLRVVYRHYPYSGIHKHAQKAAEAAEAAGAQGKFWEMHDLLFEHQDALREKDLLKYAGQLGLDRERFRHELNGDTYAERVRENFRAGVQNGVFSTPGLFLNGVRQTGQWDETRLRGALSGSAASVRS